MEAYSHSSKFHNRFIASTYVLLIILIVGSATYAWQHAKIKSLNKQLSLAQAQLAKKQLPALFDDHNLHSAIFNSSENSHFLIPQLKISLSVPSFLNLSYHYSSNNSLSYADLSSSELSAVASTCSASTTIDSAQGQALGRLIKGNGHGKNQANELIVKQYPSYYIAYIAPDSFCSPSPTVKAMILGQLILLDQSLVNLQTI